MIESSDQVDVISGAIVALQADLSPVPKDKENPFFKSKYADLGSVVEASKELRAQHGLGLVQMPDFDGEHDLLTTRIVHTSGQWLQASMRLHLTKTDPQAQGSALTYARRYSYGGALGIVTEDDDDGAAASNNTRKRQGPQQQATPRGLAAGSAIAALKADLNALPDRAAVKTAFLGEFGRPESLVASRLEAAQRWVNERKEGALAIAGVKDTPGPEGGDPSGPSTRGGRA